MTTTQKIAGFLVPAVCLLAFSAPAFAADLGVNVGVSTGAAGTSVSTTTHMSAETARSSTEIANRVTSLTDAMNRINGMVHVDASTKASLSASMNATIASLGNLKTKIASDDAADLKTDMLSITQGTRVYMLLLPKARILAAADRASTIADMFTSVDTKIQLRVTDATTKGDNVSAIVSAESDMTAKTADAKVQATAAISAVSGLTADNGNQTVMASNDTALKTARADIAASTTDLKAARADLKTIVSDLKAFGDVTTSSTTTTSTSTSAQ